MKLLVPDPAVAPFGLRAMATVARAAADGLGQPHRAVMDAAQHLLLHTALDVDALAPIDPRQLAAHVADPDMARQLVRGMVVVSLAAGPPTPEQTELVAAFARALRVDEPAVDAIGHLARHEMLRFALDFYRRSNLGDYVENQYKNQGGILAVAKSVLGFKGLVKDPELAARFHALGKLPEDTWGHGLYRYYADNGFHFPGEAGGFPVGALFHDFGHVLAGYDASPEGELQIAAFQAGYRKSDDAFFTILFAVLIHTAGVNVSPIPMPKVPGRIGEGDLAERMLHALQRGNEVNTDLADGWDFWPWVEVPLEEARRRLGVPPL